MQQRFEHQPDTTVDPGRFSEILKTREHDGWELVTVATEPRSHLTVFHLFFKRPISCIKPEERTPDPGYN